MQYLSADDIFLFRSRNSLGKLPLSTGFVLTRNQNISSVHSLALYRFFPVLLFSQGVFCRFLLGFLLAGSDSGSDVGGSYIGPHRVGLVMVRSGLGEHFVGRGASVLRLGDFLEIGFRVHIELLLEDFRKGRVDVFFHEGFRMSISKIEIERSEEGLERIRDDVRIGIPPGEELSFGNEDIILKAEPKPYGCEILPSDERTADVGEFSFRLGRIGMEEEFRGDELENRVSEEFETLVGFGRMDNVLVQHRSVDERETVIGDIFEWNLKRRYE